MPNRRRAIPLIAQTGFAALAGVALGGVALFTLSGFRPGSAQDYLLFGMTFGAPIAAAAYLAGYFTGRRLEDRLPTAATVCLASLAAALGACASVSVISLLFGGWQFVLFNALAFGLSFPAALSGASIFVVPRMRGRAAKLAAEAARPSEQDDGNAAAIRRLQLRYGSAPPPATRIASMPASAAWLVLCLSAAACIDALAIPLLGQLSGPPPSSVIGIGVITSVTIAAGLLAQLRPRLRISILSVAASANILIALGCAASAAVLSHSSPF
ncbi:hypothetical protein [Leucobacter luti]|uniref:hypothetical protein n=1 Tax=Leucobacter luti TaxID=340320 RepID=UPI003CFEA5B5